MAAGLMLVALVLAWQLGQVLLLLFGSIILALVLRGASDAIARHTPLRHPGSLFATIILITAALVTFAVLFGVQVRLQLDVLLTRLPSMADALGRSFGVQDLGSRFDHYVADFADWTGIAGSIALYMSSAVGVISTFLLVFMGGIYLALDPDTYRYGFVNLLPRAAREQALTTLNTSGRALQLWLLGQLLAMVMVGAAITLGLYVLGVPSALALGLLAGLFEFIPLVGPAISALPAIAAALTIGVEAALWVTGLYVVVQQVESGVIVPIIQRRAVDLPPVLGLFSIVALGVLFGPLGVLLGTPLTVVMLVAVKQIYVREILDEQTSVPGEIAIDDDLREP